MNMDRNSSLAVKDDTNGFSLEGAGIALKQSFVSSPITPLSYLFGVISFFCLITFWFYPGMILVWICTLIIFGSVYIWAFFKNPEKLMSEKYNYFLQQLFLGDKTKGLKLQETTTLYQPIIKHIDTKKNGKQ